MWCVCGWSALLFMCVFTPYVHTIDGVKTGVNSMVSSDKPRKPPPYMCQQHPWAPYRPPGAVCQQHFTAVFTVWG